MLVGSSWWAYCNFVQKLGVPSVSVGQWVGGGDGCGGGEAGVWCVVCGVWCGVVMVAMLSVVVVDSLNMKKPMISLTWGFL